VVKEFEDVELYWLLNGKGSFPPSDKPSPIPMEKSTTQEEKFIDESITADKQSKSSHSKKIERIVIFFEDGTFKEYLK